MIAEIISQILIDISLLIHLINFFQGGYHKGRYGKWPTERFNLISNAALLFLLLGIGALFFTDKALGPITGLEFLLILALTLGILGADFGTGYAIGRHYRKRDEQIKERLANDER